MTAAVDTRCPFPLPGELVGRDVVRGGLIPDEELTAFPVGTVIAYADPEDDDTTYVKTAAPNTWTVDGDETTNPGWYRDEDNGGFRVQSIPVLRANDLAQMPVGTLVWRSLEGAGHGRNTGFEGVYRCVVQGIAGSEYSGRWEGATNSDRHNSYLGAPQYGSMYLISRPDEPEVEALYPTVPGTPFTSHAQIEALPVGSVINAQSDLSSAEWTRREDREWHSGGSHRTSTGFNINGLLSLQSLPTPEPVTGPAPVTVPMSAVTEGMLVQSSGCNPWLVYRVEGDRWHILHYSGDGMPFLDSYTVPTAPMDRLAQSVVTLLPQTREHEVAMRWAQAQWRIDHPDPVPEPAAVGELNRLRDQVERFGDRLLEMAGGDLDEDEYDELQSRFDFLPSRQNDYLVTVTVTGTITKTVTAVDEGDARDDALNEISISVGDERTLHSEDFTVTNVQSSVELAD